MARDRRMRRWTLINSMIRVSTCLLFALAASPATFFAQVLAQTPPGRIEPILDRKEATDLTSGIHYVRLLLSLGSDGDTTKTVPPRLIVECEDLNGKHEVLWFVSFGGIQDPGFEPPFRPTHDHPHRPHLLAVDLKLTFEGYIKSKPFTRSWSLLPSGELQYRNSGLHSPNMETTRWFLDYLGSLPGLRIAHAQPAEGNSGEIFFSTEPLLHEFSKTPICSP